MQVSKVNLQALFSKQVRYEIPQYQRPYVWDKLRQWNPLWEDIRDTTERHLELHSDTTNELPTSHFLGAVVLQQQPSTADMVEIRTVVDGQQRITTMQLLLDAMEEVIREYGDVAARRLSTLVLNDEAYYGSNADFAYKVWPSLMDQNAFRHAMRNDLLADSYSSTKIVRAHEFFKLQVRQWLDSDESDTANRIAALDTVVRTRLEMVVIDLEQTDDPHVIFETLNARGTPLLQSDLIKNQMSARQVGHRWSFDDAWWRTDVTQGRITRPRVDVLLNHWLEMRNGNLVSADRVSSTFQDYIKDAASIEDIAEDMGSVGAVYRSIEENKYPDMDLFQYRWRIMQVGVLTPVLLSLKSLDVPQEQFRQALRAIESYLIRRMVCRMTAKDYNHLFLSLTGLLEKSSPSQAGETVLGFLAEQKADARLWPDDQRLESTFLHAPLYQLLTRGRLRIVLEGTESALRTDKADSESAPRNLTIEHVMPQKWGAHWPLNNVEDTSVATANRNRIIHSIGNLTLVNNKLNPALSNAPWDQKRETLRQHFTLFLNKDLLDNAGDTWKEDAIKERAQRLYQAATKAWPHPDSM